ncbi:MAG TPA: penicillin acylase family protein, partial [Solirubrobacteraceae bacterium]|nr:penicillin acylase family protein [Solirubrobacteraceae bacterium]
MGRRLIATFLCALAAAPAAHAAEGVRNVLPPGANGRANGPELAAFLATGARPAHNDDQLQMYAGLNRAPRPFTQQTLEQHFKAAPIGTRTRRDEYGVPHIVADTREAAMYAIGYATAEDRLFFMDVFRHLGRAQLSSFAGGAPANRAFDALMWSVAPYTEEDLRRQTEARPPGFEAEADKAREDLRHYLRGINAYIAEARMNPLKMPGEYAAIGRPEGPDDWKAEDVVATAAVIGAIFGVGGGKEIDTATALQLARKRFGRRRGTAVWRAFRSVDDPEAVTTVRGKRFPYALRPKRARGVALPDPGSVKPTELAEKANAPGATTRSAHGALKPRGMSNAVLVSAAESQSGRPLAVFGPQTAYFSPQVLMEHSVRAPGLEARGVAFPGVNLYVQLGHGRDYAWSATTSGQDLVDTFAVPLCDDTHYRLNGACEPIETLTRTNAWEPNTADPTPAGSETLTAERTKLGLVRARATVKGKPVLLTSLRSTYRHETDSGVAFSRFNDPAQIRSPQDFQRAAALIPFTFNWFYADREHVAYQNAGANPRRAKRTDPSLPMAAKYAWPIATDRALTETSTPPERHPSALDQPWFADWNGKQAHGYGAADGNWSFGPVTRQQLLAGRVKALTKDDRKTTLPELTEAVAGAATVDLRGDAVLPVALRVLGPRAPEITSRLAAWHRDGAHRADRDGDGTYEHAEAIRIMDAWWPRWVRAQFEPRLGTELFDAIAKVNEIDNHPNNHGDHVGSAWQYGWYGFVHKDLRRVLDRRVRGWPKRALCGSRARCAKALETSLREAAAVPASEVYGGDTVCGSDTRAECFDAIWHR